MFVHRSNRSERLVDALSEVVRRPLASPLAPELIAVQSKGMERYLAMELSLRLGVFANAQFPFPRRLLDRLFETVLGDPKPASAAFSEQALSWSVAALLPSLLGEPAFEPLARYLREDGEGRLRLQLARRIARVFDQYAVYRPELVFGWERGEDSGWQAALWRALVARNGRNYPAARAERLIAALAAEPAASLPLRLPERLSLFGISSLPPLYVSVFGALSKHVETHLFLLSPSREYFADIRRRPAADDAGDGHPLLASLGLLGREFQAVLEERCQYVEDERDLFVDPGLGCTLHVLQSDILGLRDRGAERDPGGASDEPARAPIAASDVSLSIHVCHSPLRELEALRDQLLATLEDESIEPHEIAVMAPDIEAYAPAIEAVFGRPDLRQALPYSVADRKTRTTHEGVDALYALIELLRSRMTASGVLDLLSFDPIRRRFGIASEELEIVREWVEESGIRWGADADHREEVGQPGLLDNTWRLGLDRLLLGYALPERGGRIFAGVLPHDGAVGTEAQLLGKLAALGEALFQERTALKAPRVLGAWREQLLGLLDRFLEEDPAGARDRRSIEEVLDAVVAAAADAGFTDAIDLDSLLGELERGLDERLPARGLLDRGITFCQLVPMRSIPFKVVCLIGMNDDAFPGKEPKLTFDRMSEAGQRRAGDRSRRDDDRYMFLEALLAARERVIVSYVGRSIRDNGALPPSVVVGELIDALARGFLPESVLGSATAAERRAAIERRLCTVHRLHGFSPRYFRPEPDGRLFSYARDDCEAARALGLPREDPRPFEGELPEQAGPFELTLEQLIEWVTVPGRAFLRNQLGVVLSSELLPIPDREPLTLEALDRWQLGSELLGLALEGEAELERLWPSVRARGVLPLGTPGELAFERVLPEVRALSEAVLRHRGGARLPPLSFALELAGARLHGAIDELFPAAHVFATFSRVGGRFELEHFVRHVALDCALRAKPEPGYPRRSVVVARGPGRGSGLREIVFEPLDHPERVLADLIELARIARQKPLAFHYDPARALADALSERPDRPLDALSKARSAYNALFELDRDPYSRMLFPSFETLTEDRGPISFGALCERILGPFLSARSER